MRVVRIALSFVLIFPSLLPASPQFFQMPQQLPTSTMSAPDSQAVSALKQALDAAGGVSLVGSISDYTASGNIVLRSEGNEVQGSVTVLSRHSDQFRMDTVLPTGAHSWVTSKGKAWEKAENGTVTEILGLSVLSPGSLINPYVQLIQILKGRSLTVQYIGQVSVDGISAYDIQIQRLGEC
jgi:hypothetical protein